jgi:hypothetical protein
VDEYLSQQCRIALAKKAQGTPARAGYLYPSRSSFFKTLLHFWFLSVTPVFGSGSMKLINRLAEKNAGGLCVRTRGEHAKQVELVSHAFGLVAHA